MPRSRADTLLVARGLFESRARAQEAIRAGLVSADGVVLRKAAESIAADAEITAAQPHPYVSRGGLKLAAALDAFAIDPRDRIACDLGASTGGFTDVLLQRGARIVHAVDVGRGQLHQRIAGNPRVVSMEGCDARRLDAQTFAEAPDLLVADVSFISLKHVIPPVLPLLAAPAEIILLIKPQFEAGRAALGKGGIVRDEAVQREVCDAIARLLADAGGHALGVIESPIRGGDGNREFLMGARLG